MQMDERLRHTWMTVRARGFLLLFGLLLIDLNYRLLILEQSTRDLMDLAVIVLAVAVFVVTSLMLTGGLSGIGKKLTRIYVATFLVTNVVHLTQTADRSASHILATLVETALALAAVALLLLVGNYAWERRKGLTQASAEDA